MMDRLSKSLAILLKAGLVLLIFNEVRGFILAVPVIYGIYQAGGDMMALWIGFCSLAGIALSVLVPIVVAKRAGRFIEARSR